MCRLLNWKVGWLFTLDDTNTVFAGRVIRLRQNGTIRDQRPLMSSVRNAVDGGASNTRGGFKNPLSIALRKRRTRLYDHDCSVIGFHCCELSLQIIDVV